MSARSPKIDMTHRSVELPRTHSVPAESRFAPALVQAATDVMALAKQQRLTLVTAESCTSGLLATVLSEAPGAARLLHGGFVTYTKQNKTVAGAFGGQGGGLPGGRPRHGGRRARPLAGRYRGRHHRRGRSGARRGWQPGRPRLHRGGPPRLPRRRLERDYGDLGREAVRERAMADALAVLRRAAQL
jgi:nicotinamide-nucleotide amidase